MKLPPAQTIGVLISGGLDSSILVAHLLAQANAVQPFYIRCGLAWEAEESHALGCYLRAVSRPALLELVELTLPLGDVYQGHWSLTGEGVPGADTPDEAVYLPGRNPLLLIKAALWCQLHGIQQLAMAHLGANPFADATPIFFEAFQDALNRAVGGQVRIARPLAGLTKQQVMELGRDFPLELTFSCLAPARGLHCGQCNKCAERRKAFRSIGVKDATRYAADAASLSGLPTH